MLTRTLPFDAAQLFLRSASRIRVLAQMTSQ
jgi:hypothetical protein